jgi:hypothetical protein
MIFQIFLVIFAVFAVSRVYKQYVRRKVSVHWFVLWTALWITAIAVALWPKNTDIIASWVGVGRGADLIVYLSVVFLFYSLYRAMARQEKMHGEITELVRRIAILEEIKKH